MQCGEGEADEFQQEGVLKSGVVVTLSRRKEAK